MIAFSNGRRPRPRAFVRASGLIITLLLALSGSAHSQSLQTYIIRDLGSLGGESRAMGVNSQGYAVGYYIDAQNRQRPFRWDLGVGMVDIGSSDLVLLSTTCAPMLGLKYHVAPSS